MPRPLRAPGNTQRPNASGKPERPRRHRREQSVVRSIGVLVPGRRTPSATSKRNDLLDGPAYINLDASLAKWFIFKSDVRAEFRIDAFNATNRPQFERPNGELGNARFGQITTTQAGTERVVRFGLRVVF